jgi:uncharacterized protein YxjI
LVYCPECGIELKKPDQKFCEQCGANFNKFRIEDNQDSVAKPQIPKQTSQPSGGLFDINRNYYIIKEKQWDFGGGEILDDKGQVIGIMKRKIFSIRKRVDLLELDGKVSASIHAKIISARNAQDLKDEDGELIARIKKKILTLLKPKFFLEDPEGNRWYEAQGDFMGFSFKVKDLSTGNIIAEIEKADKWRDVFLSGFFDYKDTYALRILDNETDRRILVGFVLSIDNTLHDT